MCVTRAACRPSASDDPDPAAMAVSWLPPAVLGGEGRLAAASSCDGADRTPVARQRVAAALGTAATVRGVPASRQPLCTPFDHPLPLRAAPRVSTRAACLDIRRSTLTTRRCVCASRPGRRRDWPGAHRGVRPAVRSVTKSRAPLGVDTRRYRHSGRRAAQRLTRSSVAGQGLSRCSLTSRQPPGLTHGSASHTPCLDCSHRVSSPRCRRWCTVLLRHGTTCSRS